MKKTPYHFLSEEEVNKNKQQEQEIQGKIKALAELGASCLNDERFKRYKEEYQKLERLTYRYLEDYPANEDPIKDAYQIRAAVNKLAVLRLLIRSVERDSKHGRK